MISLPESKFNIVVFPQPDGPTIAVKVLGENFPEHGLRMIKCLTSGLLSDSLFIPVGCVKAPKVCSTLFLCYITNATPWKGRSTVVSPLAVSFTKRPL